MKTLTLEEIKAAQERITTRHGQNHVRLKEIEGGLTAKLIRFALGELSSDELDKDAEEMSKRRNIAAEDTSQALEYFNKLAQEISARVRFEQHRSELLESRRSFALKFNALIARTSGFNLAEETALAGIRTNDITGPHWHRLTSMRASFGAQPEGIMTFAEYASLPFIDLDLIV